APESLDIKVLLNQLTPLLRRIMGEEIETEIRVSEPVNHIRADRAQMETLLVNLAIHARESMLGGGKMSVCAENLSLSKPMQHPVYLRPGEYLVLSISDTGLGFSEEYQEHLFEPFFGAAQPGKNTGLGLATVYATVRQHGGQIACASEIGKGST